MNRLNHMRKDGDADRAVSPVVSVILLVGIAVILTAILGFGVLDVGGNLEETARAGVDYTVNNEENNITISITSMGNSDYIVIAGADGLTNEKVEEITPPGGNATSDFPISGSSEDVILLNQTGTSITISADDGQTGLVSIVAVIGDMPANRGDTVPASSIPVTDTQTVVARIDLEGL